MRITARGYKILGKLDEGVDIINDVYASHLTPGRPAPLERTLSALSDHGLIHWDESVCDVTITERGRAVLQARKR